MDQSVRALYEFGDFQLDPIERLLLRGGQPVPLAHKVFETLLLLVQNTGHVLGKEELMERIWPDSFVEETNLAQNVSILRKALGEGAESTKFIETVPKRGYRFVVAVKEVIKDQPSLIIHERTRAHIIVEETDDERGATHSTKLHAPLLNLPPETVPSRTPAASALQLPPLRQTLQTRYVQSGDANIAYQIVGDGPIDLVFVMGWVSHLDYFWEEPSFAYFLHRLASFSRLILFDKRGTGLSDRVPLNQLPTLEQRMEDVHAVMDAVGSERAVLCGISEGGPMCSLFAATYPERTMALVMIGSYARRLKDKDYPWGPTAEEREYFFQEIVQHWGGPVGIEDRAPSLMHDERFCQWWSTYLRMGASPGAALALTKMNAEIDIRPILPTIRVPTLVLHRTGDTCLRVEEGRYVASAIPAAKFVELPGIDHLPFVGDQDAILDEIEEFLTGMRHAPEYDRVLATVLCTRITNCPAVDERVPSVPVLSDHHYAYVRKEVELFRGRESELNECGLIATFDGPARAIRCAAAINESALRMGIPIQTGVHTGECDLIGNNKVSGMAVNISSQIARLAGVHQILVSGTVKDLVAGSGIHFADYGWHRLAGTEHSWRLFTVH
jgi:pimeloyl-ACP methyl ester carboxylesterase/DNA-binding winged helix-turn-helix (wHTH) protein/class 3 adenylate cyclase